MKTCRLHFHLGPVKGFVGGARRTRDVWAGSFILSWLSASALHAALAKLHHDVRRVVSPDGVTADPTYRAVRGEPIQPFLGTFPNQFILLPGNQHAQVAEAAISAVRGKWTALGEAVASFIFDAEVGGRRLRDVYPEAHDLFLSQIRVGTFTPMWEILTVVDKGEDYWAEIDGIGHLSPMALRKLNRWSADAAVLPPEQIGALCTMLPGWREISAIDGGGSRKDERRQFWADVREVLVVGRYGTAGRFGADWECLDLRPTEQLSAPALVKRVFPLLPEDKLVDIIGWMPLIRAPKPPPEAGEPANVMSWLEAFKQFIARINGTVEKKEASPAAPDEGPSFPEMAKEQPIMLWPSTSYMAAIHWLENVQRHTHSRAEANRLAAAVEKVGRHLRFAERSLFVKCTSIENRSNLADVDGACFFETSVERLIKEAQGRQGLVNALQEVATRLRQLYDLPLDPEYPDGPRIGAPAPIYAVLHADGDGIGKILAKEGSEKSVSAGLAKFIGELRGGSGDLGIIAENNGVTLYAAADEVIAMCPLEDALGLAIKIDEVFTTSMGTANTDDRSPASKKNDARGTSLPSETPTISVAITLAHRQVPLSWVLESGKRLLDDVAKKQVGRAALAIEVLDAGGRRLDWAANWLSPGQPINSLRRLIALALGQAPSLGSNQFMHSFAEILAPLLLDDPSLGLRARVDAMKDAPVAADLYDCHVVAHALMRGLVSDFCKDEALDEGKFDRVASDIIKVSKAYWREGSDRRLCYETHGLLSGNGLRLLRFIVENWRGDPPMEVGP